MMTFGASMSIFYIINRFIKVNLYRIINILSVSTVSWAADDEMCTVQYRIIRYGWIKLAVISNMAVRF